MKKYPKPLVIIMIMVTIIATSYAAETHSIVTERFGGTAPGLDHEGVMKYAWFGIYAGEGHTDSNILYHQYDKPYDKAEGIARRNAVYFNIEAIVPNTRILKA